MTESEFIALMRGIAGDPAARGLEDDAAVMEFGDRTLVLTHDMIVEGVHFLGKDPPGDVAWKLLAVNLSDLAAKGARPVGALLGYTLGEADWDRAFAEGLKSAASAFGIALLGGDTVSAPTGSARTFGLTAIGEAAGAVPSRAGARAGDHLWVSGTIGDSGAGLKLLKAGIAGGRSLVERYRNPRPRLEAGQRLAPLVGAMMDVSDGLLIDSGRMAAASKAAIRIDIGLIPLSEAFLGAMGEAREARLFAASAGDDYELLFAAAPERSPEINGLADEIGLPLSRIGEIEAGEGLSLCDGDEPIALPDRLGWEHR
ncbi:MAG TPA: thiamine-phosphate kinase [Allosphingosinicella sp.]|nr:thiamine-phosphate kinase [Allosphingosinicella sp.]